MRKYLTLYLFILSCFYTTASFSHAQEEETKCKMCKLMEIDKRSDENYFLLEFICNNKNFTLLSNKEWNKVKGNVPLKKGKSYCLDFYRQVYYEHNKGNYTIDLRAIAIELNGIKIGGKENPVYESPELKGLWIDKRTQSKSHRSK